MNAYAVLLVVLAAVSPVAAGLDLSAPASMDCAGFAVREGIGPSCIVEGGFEVVLPDGARFVTHGPDPVVPGHLTGSGFPAEPRAPACVQDPLRERHGLVIYAHPVWKPNGGEATVHELREMVALANGLLHREATERGAPQLDYRMLCDENGDVQVDVVTLPITSGRTPDSTADYYRIVGLLRAMGYDNPNTKYWIWYDDPSACGCGGVADRPGDNARRSANAANGGPNYAITFGYTGASGAFVMMHESGHNMGAVSMVAPDSSGGGHCNDGLDIMCYADGGSKSRYDRYVCRDRIHFDCDGDTYFNPRPPEDTFLARRWNLAAPLNRFVEGCLYAERQVSPADLGIGGTQAWIDIPAACQGARFAALGEHLAPPTQFILSTPPFVEANDVDVCWFAGDEPLGCHRDGFTEEGVVPTGATRALLEHKAGANGRLLLSLV